MNRVNGLTLFFVFFLIGLCLDGKSQIDYSNGNSAYCFEKSEGYRNITIQGGDMVYTFDFTNYIYKSGNHILIPNLVSQPNGEYVVDSLFYGYGVGGQAFDSLYQWDNTTLLSNSSVFDQNFLFVSPVSDEGMPYCKTLQYENQSGYNINISGPVNSLLYGMEPDSGLYYAWEGEELVNGGDLKGTGIDHKFSQQQLDTTGEYCSYCAKTYGPGWRLPTDIEVGHYNDLEGTDNGWDNAYHGSSYNYIWTSSLFKIYNVKRWPVGLSDGYWENCAGFLYVSNYVRCVYSAYEIPSDIRMSADKNIISCYPNPADDYIIIGNTLDNLNHVYCEILNLSGQVVIRKKLSNAKEWVNISNLKSGLYILSIEGGDTSVLPIKFSKL